MPVAFLNTIVLKPKYLRCIDSHSLRNLTNRLGKAGSFPTVELSSRIGTGQGLEFVTYNIHRLTPPFHKPAAASSFGEAVA
jgi:hypothetical protein